MEYHIPVLTLIFCTLEQATVNGLMEALGVERIIRSNDAFRSFDIGSFKLTSSEFEDVLIFLFSCRGLYIIKGFVILR